MANGRTRRIIVKNVSNRRCKKKKEFKLAFRINVSIMYRMVMMMLILLVFYGWKFPFSCRRYAVKCKISIFHVLSSQNVDTINCFWILTMKIYFFRYEKLFQAFTLADVLFEKDHECSYSFVEDDFVNFL